MSRNVRFWLLSPVLVPIAAITLLVWALGALGNRVLNDLGRD